MKRCEPALLILVLGCSLALRLPAHCPDGSPPPCRTARMPVPSRNGVAVLYFSVQDTAVRYLADGVTEDVATSLGRVDRLSVKTPAAVRGSQRDQPRFQRLVEETRPP